MGVAVGVTVGVAVKVGVGEAVAVGVGVGVGLGVGGPLVCGVRRARPGQQALVQGEVRGEVAVDPHVGQEGEQAVTGALPAHTAQRRIGDMGRGGPTKA